MNTLSEALLEKLHLEVSVEPFFEPVSEFHVETAGDRGFLVQYATPNGWPSPTEHDVLLKFGEILDEEAEGCLPLVRDALTNECEVAGTRKASAWLNVKDASWSELQAEDVSDNVLAWRAGEAIGIVTQRFRFDSRGAPVNVDTQVDWRPFDLAVFERLFSAGRAVPGQPAP